MERITTHNYEAFMLDHFEGTLSKEDSGRLLLFLESHPALKEDFFEFEMINLSDFENDDISFEHKTELKQHAELDILLIGQLEGVNSSIENKRLAELLKAVPNAQAEQAKYSKTILPKTEIIFPNKSKLKKKGIVIPMEFWYSAAAAIIIGFVFLFDFSSSSKSQHYQAKNIDYSIEKIALKSIPNIEIDSEKNIDEDSISTPYTPRASFQKNPVSNISKQETPKTIKNDESLNKKIINNSNENLIVDNNIVADSSKIAPTNKPEMALPNVKLEEPQIALANNNNLSELTVKEFLLKKTKEKLFKDDLEPEKMNSNDVISSLADKVNKKTKSEISYSTTKENKKKTTRIKIGKFEFYRSKKA